MIWLVGVIVVLILVLIWEVSNADERVRRSIAAATELSLDKQAQIIARLELIEQQLNQLPKAVRPRYDDY